MSEEISIFNILNNVDIKQLTRKKGKFDYLSWANAVREVSKIFPDINWNFTEWEGVPFLETKIGYFVECSVTIKGVTKKQMMPVLDFKNQTNKSPTAMDINKCQMRALTKALALHGLGIDLWAGEDINGDYEEDGSQKVELYIDDNQKKVLFELLCNADGNLNQKGVQVQRAFKFISFDEVKFKDYEKILRVFNSENN